MNNGIPNSRGIHLVKVFPDLAASTAALITTPHPIASIKHLKNPIDTLFSIIRVADSWMTSEPHIAIVDAIIAPSMFPSKIIQSLIYSFTDLKSMKPTVPVYNGSLYNTTAASPKANKNVPITGLDRYANPPNPISIPAKTDCKNNLPIITC